MTYLPNVWTDRAVSTPNTYTKSGETSTEVTLVAKPGTVTQVGTAINASNMNKIEQGIANAVPKGASNSDTAILLTLLHEMDTRSVVITRTSGLISKVEEKDGSTILRTTTVARVNGRIDTVSVDCGGDVVQYTINRDVSGYATSVTKAII